MQAKELIPVKKEFLFLSKIIAVIIAGAGAALAILYVFLSKPLADAYGSAIRLMEAVYREMNVYIVTAILVQLIFASLVIYFTALLYSHKIAGPVFRLKAVLREYMEGRPIEKVSFRQTDFIPGVSRIFTQFFKGLDRRRQLLEEGHNLAVKMETLSGAEREALVVRLKTIISELEE